MIASETGAPEEIARALTDLVKAALERRGEVGTIDLSRARASTKGDETSREGAK